MAEATLTTRSALYVTGILGGKAGFFITQLVLANWLGPSQFGIFVLAYTVVVGQVIVTPLGAPQIITRFASPHHEHDLPQFLAIVTMTGACVLVVAILVTLLLGAAAEPIANRVFGEPALAFALLVLAPLVLIKSLFLVLDAIARASLNAHLSGFHATLAVELGTLVLVLAALQQGMGLIGALAAFLLGNLAGLLVLTRLIARLWPKGVRVRARWREVQLAPMLAFGLQVSMISSVAILNLWADRLMLGVLATAAAVGIYQVAAQLVGIAITASSLVNALFEPVAGRLVARGASRDLGAAYGRFTSWGLHAVLPLFIVFVLTPESVIGLLFGPGYAAATVALVVLGLGQLVRTACGPIEILLLMRDRQRTVVAISAIGLGLNLALNAVLIPLFSVTGAAATSAFVNGALALVLLQVARRQGILVAGSLKLRPPLLAGGLALGITWAGLALLDPLPRPAELLVGLALSYTAYLGVLWWRASPDVEALLVLARQVTRVGVKPKEIST